jgi:cytochrome P450
MKSMTLPTTLPPLPANAVAHERAAKRRSPLPSPRMDDLPPGPRSSFLPIVQYLRDPMGVMPRIAKRWGDPFTLRGSPPTVFTGDPAGIKAIYSADPAMFAVANKDMGVFLGSQSLILIEGDEHKRKRKLMMPPFHGARMRKYGEAMIRLTEQHTAEWKPGRTVSGFETAQKISLDVILEAVFGVRDPGGRSELAAVLLELLNGFSPLLAVFPALRRELGGVGPFARFKRRQAALHAKLDALIAEARTTEPRDDILSLLVGARYEDGEPMSDQDVREQLLLLVVAGYDTTAIAIAWALDALHRPQSAAAREQLAQALRGLGPEPEPERLDKLPYLEAVCQETLRRYPGAPAPSPRKLLQPLELMGRTLPAGTGVAAAIGIAHFREETYPEPLQFRPERFLERKFSPFEYLPFGGGARRCLGAAVAAYEMRLVLGTIMGRFHLRLASQKPDHGKVRAANVGPAGRVELVVEG